MMWTPDPLIEAARKLPGWVEFSAECRKVGLYFDIHNREKNRGPFTVVAVTIVDRKIYELNRATAKCVVRAMQRAHDDSGRGNATTTALLARMLNREAEPVVPAPDPLEEMFG